MAIVKKADWGRFEPISNAVNHRLVFRSYGPEKTGKNHFGFTAPGPIAVLSFDIGLEGTVEKFLRAGKDIRYVEYEFAKNDVSQEAAQVMVAQFMGDYAKALEVARTIIIDTETELWDLFRYAEFGVNKQGVSTDAPKDYVKLNSNYRDFIQQAYDGGVNLQLIQKVKERWKTNEKGSPVPSGNFEPSGFKEAGYIVQASLSHSFEGRDEAGVPQFGIEVKNCRQNMALAGECFTNIDFPTLAQLVFPDSTEENWS
jgi:hypothetical protein